MIIRQYRLIMKAREINQTTKNAYSVTQQLGLPPFIAKKVLSQSSKYTGPELVNIYDKLIDIDRLTKSSPEQVRTAITMFIAKL